MATDYFFELDTMTKSPQMFLQDTARRFSFNWVGENLTDSALLIAAGGLSPLARNIAHEDLGIRPTVSVLFNFDSSKYTEETYRLMVRICADWLSREPGDAVLTESASGHLFLRKTGVLTIDTYTLADWWTADLLALMPKPWQRANLLAY